MAVVEEILRSEADGSISFGNHKLAKKVMDRLCGVTKLIYFLAWSITSMLTYDTRVLAVMLEIGRASCRERV